MTIYPLPWDEEQALKEICAYHGVSDRELLAHLAIFCNWIHQSHDDATPPPPLLCVLGQLGMYARRHQQEPETQVA